MKKQIGMLMLVAVAMGVFCNRVNAERRVAVVRSGDVVRLFYKSDDAATVRVVIKDEAGDEVFKEELHSVDGFIRPYNFSKLPKGNYTICIKDQSGEKIECVAYKDIDQAKLQDNLWFAHLGRIAGNEKKVMVAVPYQGQSNFSVEVLDSNDLLLYTEEVKTNGEYAKVLNLNKVGDDTTVRLTNHNTGEVKKLTPRN